MTTIVTADLHLAENPRDAYRFQFLERALPALVEEHEATRVLVLGDLCEVKDSHRAPLVNRLVDGFAALAELADVYVLMGNHDYVSEDVPFYRFLRHLDRVRWISEPALVNLRNLGKCLFLPHTRRMDEDWKNISQPEWVSCHWIFCHQTFGGSDLGHGHRAEGAAPPFTKGAKVVSGDVHVPQKVGPVTYVGSPYGIDFGDDFDPRVLVLDDEEMVSVPVPGPQKLMVTVSELADFEEDLGPEPGDVVKVRVELAPGGTTSRAEVRAATHAWAAEAGVELYAVQIVAPPTERAEKVVGRDQHRTDEQLVRTYAEKMGQGKTSLAAGLKIAEETP